MELKFLYLSNDFDRIEEIWTNLNSVSDASYFLSWGWIENWIASLPKDVLVRLAVFLNKDIPVLAFFVGKTTVIRKNIFRSNGLFLNVTGNPIYDDLCIEFNSMLHTDSAKFSFKEILERLPFEWEEFFMPGLDPDHFPGNCLNNPIEPYRIIKMSDLPSPYVDLELVRQKKGNYLSLLSSNTRYQVRRSYRHYETKGKVLLEVALDLKTAMGFFHEMVSLHKRTWQARGEPCAFASDYFLNFHKELILKRFNHGEIQILRIALANITIGILYNFVFNGKVYYYQSGLNYENDKHIKPGYICHAEAIKYNAQLDNSKYDFLKGTSQYKTSLATNEKRLIWAKVQKPQTKFWIENKLKTVKNFLQKRS